MTRWLLNELPTWGIAIVVVGGFVLLAVGGLWLVRRYLPSVHSGEANEFASVMNGVIAAVYGVFLAFAIVALYEQFHEAEEGVRSEAAALARVVVNSEGLAPRTAEAMRVAVIDYRDTVVGEEWRAMQDGESADRAWEQMERIYAVLKGFRPSEGTQDAFYGASVEAVNELVDARRSRLHAAEAELPGAIMVLLFGGGVLTLAFTLIFGVPRAGMHAAMSVALAVLLGLSLLVALVLDYPFSGDVAVTTQPYFEDALREH